MLSEATEFVRKMTEREDVVIFYLKSAINQYNLNYDFFLL